MRILLFLITFFFATNAFAQTTVRGTVADASDNEGFPGASVLLIKLPDSAQVGAATNTEGRFYFTNVLPGSYILQVSFVGYQTLQRPVAVADKPVELGKIGITEGSTQLKEVQIIGKIPPAVQNEDTAQFNAAAFKVTRDASAEDLVQKMPGVTLENGQIKTQGENVRRVLVDGKPFFGEDPAAALKNLPAEVIDKIQVFDQQSDQAKFSGFDDGNTTKTINIITKKDKKNGLFGRVYGGLGTDKRHQAGFALNQFQGDRRLTVLGQLNNINQQNFSSEDLSGISSAGGGGRGGMGGFGRGGGGGASDFQIPQLNGITTTNAAGLNYSDKWGKKISISGSYFFNQTDNDASQNLLRQYVQQGDSGRVYQENQVTATRNRNHRFNTRLEWALDSMNEIMITPRLTLQENSGTSQLFGQTRENNLLLNQTSNQFTTDLLNYNGSADVRWRHKFAKKGRTFSLGVSGGLNGNDGESTLLADNRYFTGSAVSDSIEQFSQLDRNGWNGGVNLNYTEPVSDKAQVHVNYEASYQNTDSDKRTFDFSETTGGFTSLNSQLSNTFTNGYLTQQAGVGYRFRDEKYIFFSRVNFQQAQLQNQQEFPASLRITRTFRNVLPFAMLRYNFSKTENLRLFYRSNTSPPSAEQLQNVLNNANPLVLRIGNPALKQNYQHSLNLNYGKTTTEKSRSIMAILGATFTQDYVANQTFIANQDTVVLGNIALPRGAQLTQPVNLDGQFSLRSFFTYGVPVSFKDKGLNLNFNASANYSRTPGLINSQLNYANTQNYSFGAVISSNISQNLDFTLSSTTSGVINDNTLRPQLNSQYLTQTSRIRLNWIFYKGFFVETELNHQVYAGLAEGFDRNYALWNASAGKKLFADQSAEIRLTVFDILEQNTSIQRNITEAYIEDVNTRVLQRYFMLNFSYQLRKFYGDAATAPDPADGPPRGGFGRP